MSRKEVSGDQNIDRRSVLQVLGASGVAAAGMSGTVSAESGGSELDWGIGDEVYADLQTLFDNETSRDFISFVEQDAGVRADPSIFPIGVDVNTGDYTELQRRNPRMVMMFAPEDNGASAAESGSGIVDEHPEEVDYGLGPSQELQSTRMGVVFGLVIDKEDQTGRNRRSSERERIVSHTLALSTNETENQATAADTGVETAVQFYGATEDTGASTADSGDSGFGVVQTKTEQTEKVTIEGREVTAADGCWISDENCADVLRVACAGAGASFSTGSCASAAISVGAVGGGPAGTVLAYGFCQAVTSWWGQAICQTQADEVCSGFLNSECDDGSDDDDGGGCWIPFDPTC